jgi:hypothetical protein
MRGMADYQFIWRQFDVDHTQFPVTEGTRAYFVRGAVTNWNALFVFQVIFF